MSAQRLQHSKFGFGKTIDLPYKEAVEKVRGALKDEGFGILCEIDIKEKLKEKLGVDFRDYVILAPVIRLWHTGRCSRKLESGCFFPAT